MPTFIKLSNGKHGSAKNREDAEAYLKATYPDGSVGIVEVDTLPYYAFPIFSLDPAVKAEWTLCFSPLDCRGKGYCPRSRACSE
jgi:hypothetical protein